MGSFAELRARCLQTSTRPYRARGASVERCDACQLAQPWCICAWQVRVRVNIEFVLILHRDEVFKPTNSGRLLDDLFPGQCHAYEWSRQDPPEDLLVRLQNPARTVGILFPPRDDRQVHLLGSDRPVTAKPLTVVVLDGTWRQASRMLRLSPWLAQLPLLSIGGAQASSYQVREAPVAGQLATAEAAAQVLAAAGEREGAATLRDYFRIFSEHSLASRQQRPVDTGSAAHQRLAHRLAGPFTRSDFPD